MIRAILLTALVMANGPALAATLLDAMKGKALTCGAGVSFFVDRAGSTVQMIGYGVDPGTGIAEAKLTLDAATLATNRPDRVEIVVPGPRGTTRLRFQSKGAKAAMANIGAGGIVMSADGDSVGDDCAIETGYPAFVETRFNFIREGLCGNDPLDACIAALRRSCGPSPDAACVTRTRPMLKRINEGPAGRPR